MQACRAHRTRGRVASAAGAHQTVTPEVLGIPGTAQITRLAFPLAGFQTRTNPRRTTATRASGARATFWREGSLILIFMNGWTRVAALRVQKSAASSSPTSAGSRKRDRGDCSTLNHLCPVDTSVTFRSSGWECRGRTVPTPGIRPAWVDAAKGHLRFCSARLSEDFLVRAAQQGPSSVRPFPIPAGPWQCPWDWEARIP